MIAIHDPQQVQLGQVGSAEEQECFDTPPRHISSYSTGICANNSFDTDFFFEHLATVAVGTGTLVPNSLNDALAPDSLSATSSPVDNQRGATTQCLSESFMDTFD